MWKPTLASLKMTMFLDASAWKKPSKIIWRLALTPTEPPYPFPDVRMAAARASGFDTFKVLHARTSRLLNSR
jgi:hypothetical protein